MAVSYATPQFNFVDSQFGTAATSTGIKVNVPEIVDLEYHKKVQDKTWFEQNGMIGPDSFREGSITATAAGYPVLRKTDFQGKKGDTIKMHQRTNLATTPNVGKVGGFQLTDAEVGWDLNYKLVKIEQWRQGVLTGAGMTEQRNPVSESLVETEIDLLSDWGSSVIDSGILAALHYGHSYHLLRQYGTTNLTIGANSNTLIGNNQSYDTTRTVADLTGAGDDNVKALTIEIGATYCAENNFDPVNVGGSEYFVALMSPRALSFLFRDADFRAAHYYAATRGIDNPLFKSPNGIVYRNVIIFPYQKVKSVINGYNPAGLTVSNAGATNSTITEAVYTGIGGGVSSTNLSHVYFLGANALSLAEGRMRMAERMEDDYGQLVGRAADNIWGATRMDWLDATGAAANNQSALTMVLTLVS